MNAKPILACMTLSIPLRSRYNVESKRFVPRVIIHMCTHGVSLSFTCTSTPKRKSKLMHSCFPIATVYNVCII